MDSGDLIRLLKHGIEPSDHTEHGQQTRVNLFLPRKKRQPRESKVDTRPEWLKIIQKKIRFMRTETTRYVLKRWRNNNGKDL